MIICIILFLFVYSTSAYVKPTRVVESVKPTVSINDEGKLEVVLENTGSVHHMLNSLAITLRGDDGSTYDLTEEELGPVEGQNLLTNSKLRTVIEMLEALSGAETLTAPSS